MASCIWDTHWNESGDTLTILDMNWDLRGDFCWNKNFNMNKLFSKIMWWVYKSIWGGERKERERESLYGLRWMCSCTSAWFNLDSNHRFWAAENPSVRACVYYRLLIGQLFIGLLKGHANIFDWAQCKIKLDEYFCNLINEHNTGPWLPWALYLSPHIILSKLCNYTYPVQKREVFVPSRHPWHLHQSNILQEVYISMNTQHTHFGLILEKFSKIFNRSIYQNNVKLVLFLHGETVGHVTNYSNLIADEIRVYRSWSVYSKINLKESDLRIKYNTISRATLVYWEKNLSFSKFLT